MDLPLLPGSASDNSTAGQDRTGARFTVRSANSPSYTFPRRSGIKRRVTAETHTGTNGEHNDKDTRVKDQTEEKDGHQFPTKLDKNGTTDKWMVENGPDDGVNNVLKSRGRTEWKEFCNETTSPRSQSKEDFMNQSGGSDKRTGSGIRMTGKVTSSLLRDKSPVNCIGQTSGWVTRVNSLPVRLRSDPESESRFKETHSPKGGQSIQERIQRLFESVGEKPEGGTFPRRFSSGDSPTTGKNKVAFIWSQKDTNASRPETFSSEAIKPKEKSPVRQWQRPLSAHSEGVNNWEKETVEMGTKSLDRARSRNTIAAQIRSARTAGEIFGITRSKGFLEHSMYKCGEKSASINQEIWTERLKTQEKDKETDQGTNKPTRQKSVTSDEDVFETNTQTISVKTAERNQIPETLSVTASASVRNKISQFEALTQRATGSVPLPKRTFSVPAQLHKGHDGVKKSSSVKEISERRDNWRAIKERAENETEKRRTFESGRSLSVNEAGLRLGKTETEGRENDDDDDTRLKKTTQISLDEKTQIRRRGMFFFDEIDFSKNSSSDDSSAKHKTTSIEASSQCDVSSPVSDDDLTPTNIPHNLPFTSPAPQPENPPSVADNENKTTSTPSPPKATLPHIDTSDVRATQENKTHKTDFPPILPAADSESNTTDVFYPDVKTVYPKGKKQLLDLNAWVASLDPEYKCWNEYIDNYEDDDDQSTQRDDDSNYDSDSGDSSVTVTSNMSQSDRKSFSLSLSDLYNFSGVDYDSDDDMDEWDQRGHRSASLSSDASAFSCVSLLPAEELDKLVEDVRSLGNETLQNHDDVQVVVLHKEAGVGLGFSLAGGVDQNKPITVHKVIPSGVAAREGSIREGVQVLSINGTALSGNSHMEALRVLKRAKARDMAVVVVRRSDVSGASNKVVPKSNKQPAHAQQETGQCLSVQLQKNSRDLGFSLQGGVGSSEGNRPLTVQKVFQGGPVDTVFPGDEVLEIQSISMLGMRRLEAWTFIRSLPSGPVAVVLRRPLKHQQTRIKKDD